MFRWHPYPGHPLSLWKLCNSLLCGAHLFSLMEFRWAPWWSRRAIFRFPSAISSEERGHSSWKSDGNLSSSTLDFRGFLTYWYFLFPEAQCYQRPQHPKTSGAMKWVRKSTMHAKCYGNTIIRYCRYLCGLWLIQRCRFQIWSGILEILEAMCHSTVG